MPSELSGTTSSVAGVSEKVVSGPEELRLSKSASKPTYAPETAAGSDRPLLSACQLQQLSPHCGQARLIAVEEALLPQHSERPLIPDTPARVRLRSKGRGKSDLIGGTHSSDFNASRASASRPSESDRALRATVPTTPPLIEGRASDQNGEDVAFDAHCRAASNTDRGICVSIRSEVQCASVLLRDHVLQCFASLVAE
jgi:hypothetical protein